MAEPTLIFWLSLQFTENLKFLAMQTGQPGRFITAIARQLIRNSGEIFPIFISFLFYYSTDSDSNADRNPFFFISFSFVLFFYSRHRPGGREHGERERERNLYCHCHRFSVFVLTNIEQWWALSLNVIWPEYIKLCPTVFVFSPLSLAHLNEFSTYRTHTGDWLFELLLYTLQIYSCETC